MYYKKKDKLRLSAEVGRRLEIMNRLPKLFGEHYEDSHAQNLNELLEKHKTLYSFVDTVIGERFYENGVFMMFFKKNADNTFEKCII